MMNSGSWFAKDFVREYDLDTDRKVAGVFIRIFDLNGSCLSVNVSFSVRVKRIFLRFGEGKKKRFPFVQWDSCGTRLIRLSGIRKRRIFLF